VLKKIKIILSAVGAALLFILGVFAGSKRSGGHNESRASKALDAERELDEQLQRAGSEISDSIDRTQDRIDEASADSQIVRDRIRDSAGFIDDLKKRNGLE